MRPKRTHQGIRVRHRHTCPFADGGRCNCKPGYEASVFSAHDGRKIRRTFPSLAEARAWRADATTALRTGAMRAPSSLSVAEVATTWLAGARDGSIRNRSGDVFKPSSIGSYESALRIRILPSIGSVKLSELQR